MNYQCPYGCLTEIKSLPTYNHHLVFSHEAYETGEEVKLQTIKSLEKVRERVLFLLIKFPACRRPDNGDLWIKYMQYWTGALVYDATTQDYVLNDPEAQKNHIKHRPLRWALAQLEGVRRLREKLQEEQRKKKAWIEKHEGRPAVAGKDFLDILPTPEQQALADIREEEIKIWAVS